MLKKLIQIVLPLVAMCMYTGLSAQSTFTWTEDFNNLGCNSLGGCANNGHSQTVVTPSCLSGGGTSHGTPHIVSNSFVWMGSNVEGIFLGFNFNAGIEYTITFTGRIQGSVGSTPAIANLIATNDLIHNVNCYSGSPPPVSDFENIDMTNVSSASSWTDFTVTFCPKEDYEQLWIFPSGAAVVFQLDEVNIVYEDCRPARVFWSSLPIFYQTDETITTISFFGSDPENDPNQVTEFKAEEYIWHLPNTFLSANGSNYHLDEITPCNPAGCGGGSSLVSGGGSVAPVKGRREGLAGAANNHELIAYPNPANTHFRIKLGEGSVGQEAPVKLRIMDNMGRVVFQDANYSFNDAIYTENFSNGMYTVTVLMNDVVYTQKMVIRH